MFTDTGYICQGTERKKWIFVQNLVKYSDISKEIVKVENITK